MTNLEMMKHGVVTSSRKITAKRATVYSAWTALEHRRQWFAGPGWTEIARSLDLRVGGSEIAHGRFESGIETIYTSRFHLIEPELRLIYAFDMHVDGRHFSVSLAGLDFEESGGVTTLTYTEQAFFLEGDYNAESRLEGTNWLMEQFSTYVATLS